MTRAWLYRWANETGAQGMATPDELIYLGYEDTGRIDPRYPGSRLFRREERA